MKLICIGDNVADCYIKQQIFYPGGNAVNVAVNARRDGAEHAAYLGIFGDDYKAAHIIDSLRKEHIDISRCRRMYALSGQPPVFIADDGDRKWEMKNRPWFTAQNVVSLRFIEADMQYIAGFDLCHTSCYSFLEPELPRLARVVDISYDFSDEHDERRVREICPYVRFAFFSASHMSDEEIDALMTLAHSCGTEIVGVTLGKRGAMFSKNGVKYSQGIVKTEVADTMGAGDSFIAGFLTEYHRSGSMEGALDYAAHRAAATCAQAGGFGYPAPLGGWR